MQAAACESLALGFGGEFPIDTWIRSLAIRFLFLLFIRIARGLDVTPFRVVAATGSTPFLAGLAKLDDDELGFVTSFFGHGFELAPDPSMSHVLRAGISQEDTDGDLINWPE